MTRVWELWHFRPDDEHEEDGKRIGLYSTEQNALAARQVVLSRPGFCDEPGGFKVYDAVLDRAEWQDGFGASPPQRR